MLGLFNITETDISGNRKALSTEIYNLIEDGLIIVPQRDRIKMGEEVHWHGMDFMFLQDSFNTMSLRISGMGDSWLNQQNTGKEMQETVQSDSPNTGQEMQEALQSTNILNSETQATENVINTSIKQPDDSLDSGTQARENIIDTPTEQLDDSLKPETQAIENSIDTSVKPLENVLNSGTRETENTIDASVKQPDKISWIKRVTTSILAALGIK